MYIYTHTHTPKYIVIWYKGKNVFSSAQTRSDQPFSQIHNFQITFPFPLSSFLSSWPSQSLAFDVDTNNFDTEEGDNILLRNTDIHIQGYTESCLIQLRCADHRLENQEAYMIFPIFLVLCILEVKWAILYGTLLKVGIFLAL
jgi:hypothetical protein